MRRYLRAAGVLCGTRRGPWVFFDVLRTLTSAVSTATAAGSARTTASAWSRWAASTSVRPTAVRCRASVPVNDSWIAATVQSRSVLAKLGHRVPPTPTSGAIEAVGPPCVPDGVCEPTWFTTLLWCPSFIQTVTSRPTGLRRATDATVATVRVIGGRSRGRTTLGAAAGRRAPHRRPGPRGHLRRARVHGRGRGPRSSTSSAAAAPWGSRRCRGGRRVGHLRRPRPRGPRRRADQPGRSGPGGCGRDGPAGRAARLAGALAPFDVAFCDPPYSFDDWTTLLGWLQADLAVLSRPTRSPCRPAGR